MEANKKVFDFLPVTTTKAVYIDGTNKTLQEAIDNGELNKVVTTAENYITNAYFYAGDMKLSKNYGSNDITININTKLSLGRILSVCWSNGNVTQVALEDGTVIPEGKTLVWSSVNGFEILDTITCPYNSVIVGINYSGRIVAGALQPIWDRYFSYTSEKVLNTIYNVNMKEIARSNQNTLHSMFICHGELITLECYAEGDMSGICHVYSLPDLVHQSSFKSAFVDTTTIGDGTAINLRLVTADYKEDIDALIFGNSTADGSDGNYLTGYIFYDAKNWKDYTDIVTFDNCGEYTRLDFYSDGLFPSQCAAKIVWAELDDVCYLTTENLQYCHKILLGTGTTQLSYGVYDYSESRRYNGTYEVIKTYCVNERPTIGNKDAQFYKGALYYPVKYVSGGLRIYKSYLTDLGNIVSDVMVNYDPVNNDGTHAITGSPEGFVIYNDKMITSHATYNKFYITDVI